MKKQKTFTKAKISSFKPDPSKALPMPESIRVYETPEFSTSFKRHLLKTISYRGDERDTVNWMNDFCAKDGIEPMSISVTNDGRAFTAFISYWVIE
jgi:hypothetical protein